MMSATFGFIFAAVVIFLQPADAVTRCRLPQITNCNETDQSELCHPLTRMEIGIKSGDFILSQHLKPALNSKPSGHCDNLKLYKVRKVLQAMSRLTANTRELTETGNDFQMNVVIAMSSLLADLKNKTCDWISECILIPDGLTCDEYLSHLSLNVALIEANPPFSQSCNHRCNWCVWWMEKAVCQENEAVSLKKAYSSYYANGPIFTCSSNSA